MNDRAPDERNARYRAMYRHCAAAISEGLCPAHCTPLEPSTALDRRITGYCRTENAWWWFNPENKTVGWDQAVVLNEEQGGPDEHTAGQRASRHRPAGN